MAQELNFSEFQERMVREREREKSERIQGRPVVAVIIEPAGNKDINRSDSWRRCGFPLYQQWIKLELICSQ